MKDHPFQRSQDNSSGIDHRLINQSFQVYVHPTRRVYHLLALEYSRLGNWRLADRAQRAAYAEALREMSVQLNHFIQEIRE